MTRLKLNSKLPVDKLKKVENKLLLFQSNIIMFTDVRIVVEKVRYGLRKNKFKNVSYLACRLHVYDSIDQTPVVSDSDVYVKSILTLFDVYQMRRDYQSLMKEVNTMQELENQYNEPSYMDKVYAHIKQGKKLAALKEYKDATGKSLKESKDYIDSLVSKIESDYMENVHKYLKQGKRFSAIVEYKQATGVTPTQAKDYINEIWNTQYQQEND